MTDSTDEDRVLYRNGMLSDGNSATGQPSTSTPNALDTYYSGGDRRPYGNYLIELANGIPEAKARRHIRPWNYAARNGLRAMVSQAISAARREEPTLVKGPHIDDAVRPPARQPLRVIQGDKK